MVTIAPRRPPHGDVTKIPTPPLQAAGLFINFFFPALALVVVLLRFYTRQRMHQWGWDDFLIGCAMLCSILMAGPFYLYIKLNYFGWHMEDVPEFDPQPGMWWFYLAQIFYNPVLAFVKASVLVFLLRLGGQKPGVRWAIHALNLFNALQAIAIFLVAVLQCLPISANWDSEVRATATCVDNSFHVTISCITIFTDFLVLALPLWIFLGLKMPRASKIAVIGVFLLGIAVPIVGIVRLEQLIKLFYLPDPNGDPYYSIGVTLSAVEINIAIISASIPPLRALFRHWLPSVFGGSSAKYGSSKYGDMGHNGGYYNNASGKGHNATNNSMAMKNIRTSRIQHTECRSVSPNGSEEEIMTYNGIMKSTQVHVHFDRNNNRPMDSASQLSSDFDAIKDPRPAAI